MNLLQIPGLIYVPFPFKYKMREDALAVQGKTIDSQRKRIKGNFFGVFP